MKLNHFFKGISLTLRGEAVAIVEAVLMSDDWPLDVALPRVKIELPLMNPPAGDVAAIAARAVEASQQLLNESAFDAWLQAQGLSPAPK